MIVFPQTTISTFLKENADINKTYIKSKIFIKLNFI